MLCAVSELFHQGCRLKRDQVLAMERVVGHLFVLPAEPEHSDQGRILMLAHLVWIEGQAKSIHAIPSLANPKLIRMTRSGFLLRGEQLTSSDGLNRTREVAQEWWVTPVLDSGEIPPWMRSGKLRSRV